MNRAVPHHVSHRSSSRRVTARKQKLAAPPPPPPRPTDDERRAALARAHQALRTQLWGGAGSIAQRDEQVTIHSGQISRGRPHWHLLTEGLGLKGFELSLRVQKEKDEVAPPAWAIAFLKTVAREAELSADTNQVLVLAQGVAPGTDSELAGVVFTRDPEVAEFSTPHDPHVPLLLAVPVTRDETRAVREWSPTGLIEVLSKLEPLLLTQLDRPSLLQSPRARTVIEQRMEREGSSLSSMSATTSLVSKTGDHVTWKLSADAVDTLSSLLKGRIAHQRPFSVVSGHTRVDVVNGAPAHVDSGARHLTLHLTLVAARQLRSLLKNKPGSYTFDQLPNFTLTVV